MEQLTLFKVRDLRKKDQFKIDDIYLNGYARICGIDATAVYTSLCRHAEFETQKAFPSQQKIAYEHKISVRTVRRGLKKLLDYRIVIAEQIRDKGKFRSYLYTLLDKSEWKKITEGQNRPTADRRTKTDSRLAAYGVGPTKDNKQQRITNIEGYKKRASLKKKPYYDGNEMRFSQNKWWVIKNGEWLEFAGEEKDIEFK